MNYNIIFTFCFLLLHFLATAQTFVGALDVNDEEQLHFLILKNGEEKEGRIVSIKNTTVEFLLENNNTPTFFDFSEIEKIIASDYASELTSPEAKEVAEKKEEIKLLLNQPIARGDHRLFFSETGFTLRRGEREYRTYWGNIHTLDYGVIEGYTVGFGISNFGHIILHNKFNFLQQGLHPRIRVGFDFQIAGQPERFLDDFTQVRKLGWNGFFKISTYFSIGDEQRYGHLSFNIVPVFQPDREFSRDVLLSFNFGGMVKVAPHWKLIYENTFGQFEGDNISVFGFFSSVGANWFNEKNSIKFAIHSSPNFGFFNMPINDLNTVNGLPFFSYARYF